MDIQFKPSFGHTPGHYSFKLKADGQEVVFIGDIVHSHTLQFDRPETAIEFDTDPQSSGTDTFKTLCRICQRRSADCCTALTFPGPWTYLFQRWEELSVDSSSF